MPSASKMLRQRLSSKKPRNKKRNYFTIAAEKKFIKLNFCLRKIGWEGCSTRFGYVDWQYL